MMQQLEHYPEEERDKVAVATALSFDMKLGLPPENVFNVLMNDAMVAKGTILSFVTAFMKEFLRSNPLDELLVLLRRGKVDDLMSFFPMQKRTSEAFASHFSTAGLPQLVEYNEKKECGQNIMELGIYLHEIFEAEEPDLNEAISLVKSKKKDGNLPEPEVVKLVWNSVMDAIQWGNQKNQQQSSNSALRQVKQWAKLLESQCSSKKSQAELMLTIQVYCYENNKLMKVFPDIIRLLYDQDVLLEEVIIFWHKRGSHSKGRQVFLESMGPFIKWLEEAESEEEDDG